MYFVTSLVFLLDTLRDIRERAQVYGLVSEVVARDSNVFVEFEDPWCCQNAFEQMTKLTLNGRRVVASFYPLCLWREKTLVAPELSSSSTEGV
jgi:hypothetical protein